MHSLVCGLRGVVSRSLMRILRPELHPPILKKTYTGPFRIKLIREKNAAKKHDCQGVGAIIYLMFGWDAWPKGQSLHPKGAFVIVASGL